MHIYTCMPTHRHIHLCTYTCMHTCTYAYLRAHTAQHSYMCTYLHTNLYTHTPLNMSVQHSHMFTYLHTFLCTLMYLYVVPWGPMTSLRETLSIAYLGEGFVGDKGVDMRISGPSKSWELPTT